MNNDTRQLIKKLKSFNFDANKEVAGYHVHGLHRYPARMHPHVVKILLEQLADTNSVIYEPYCGSGTVLIESMLNGNFSIGTDVNPLAVLMTRVKTTPINPNKLNKAYRIIESDLEKFKNQSFLDELPFDYKSTNLQYWFKDNTIRKLSVINHLLNYKWIEFNQNVYDFMRLSFARLVREVSTVRQDEFKLYRKPDHLLVEKTKPVFKTYLQILQDNITRMMEFYQIIKNGELEEFLPKIYNKKNDTIQLPKRPDLVITSPPYGDNPTTISYGQFSRYSLLWLGYPKNLVYSLDKVSITAEDYEEFKILEQSKTYRRIIHQITNKDQKRAKVVQNYFVSLVKSFQSISNSLKNGGTLCTIIGPRRVKDILVPNDKILIEICNEMNLTELCSIARNISSKTLPHKNSSGSTILTEKILVLEKR